MVQFLRLISVVVLDDVGAMWVRVVRWSCCWDLCLGIFLRCRHFGRCDGVRCVFVFLSLLVEKVWRVDEGTSFVCLQCLRMGRQGKDFGGCVLICVWRWWHFPWMICMAFFRSVGKTLQCQKLVCVRCGLHTRCGNDNDLMPGRCTNPHIRVLSNLLLLQVD